jgi:hypothetical protein
MGSIMLVWNSGKKSVIFDCFEVFDVAGGGICRFVELSDDAELVLERKGSNKRGNGGWVRKGSIVFVGGAGKWVSVTILDPKVATQSRRIEGKSDWVLLSGLPIIPEYRFFNHM